MGNGQTGNQSRGIAVLGMHRSGTSALAGALRSAGVHFGNVLDYAFEFNPKGLQEAPSILFMQEDLLIRNGGSWHQPPAEVTWHRLHEAVRDLFIESRSSADIWAFKDPRTLLTIEGWFEKLPELQCAAIFRHPAEVALSIQHRNRFDLDKCLEIWRRYNERLLMLRRDRDFPVVEFVSRADEMNRSFSCLLEALALERGSVEFFEAELKHHDRPALKLPREVSETYEQLRELAL